MATVMLDTNSMIVGFIACALLYVLYEWYKMKFLKKREEKLLERKPN